MEEYKIQIELMTETIFGSGQSVPGSVDLEIVYDDNGFPYMKAKTFKGNLREQVEELNEILKENYNLDYTKYIDRMFGVENDGVNSWKNIKFSDCQLQENIKEVLMYGIENNLLNKNEIKAALTDERSFNSIDHNGVSKEGALRQVRVIRKGLKFEVIINTIRELEEIELCILAAGVSSLRHIGTMRTRGKGEIDGKLMVKNQEIFKDMTDYYVDKLMEEVRKGE